MPLSRGTLGGGSVVARKRPRTSKKKSCELGKSCPYQHEYQHQLEFTHEEGTTSNSTKAARGGGERGRRGAVPSGRSLNGTGARGRTLAVAADRRRAERSLRQGVGQDLVDVHGGDTREAQRARWVMRMQEQIEEKGLADSARAGSSDGVQPLPSLASTLALSQPASLPSAFGFHHLATSSDAAPLETGCKRASPGTSNEGGAQGKGREVICVDCDTDDD